MAHLILDSFQSEKQQEMDRQISKIAIEPIIVDSLDRMQRYILNIAEMTIDQSAMKKISPKKTAISRLSKKHQNRAAR